MKRNLILLCTLLCTSMATHAVQVWDGASAEIWTKGTGTESDPYLIETPANLKYLTNQVNAGNVYADTYFLQIEDLDLNSKSCSMDKTFSGNYDGGNHQILNVRSFLFYTIQSATIQNLTIAGNITCPLVYQVNGNATLTNCHNKSTAEITNGGAGLISQAQSGRVTLTKCSNRATITSYISRTGYKEIYTGGLITKADTIIMRNCHNFGDLIPTIRANYVSGYFNTGGLVSYANYIDIFQSSNVANISYKDKGGPDSHIYSSTAAGIALTGKGIITQCFSKSSNIEYGICGSNYVICTECYATNSAPSPKSFYPQFRNQATFFNMANIAYYCHSTNVYYNGKIFSSNISETRIDVSGSKTTTELKSPSFLSLLNADGDYFCPDYTNINNGYPILRWQLGDTPFYTIRGICKAEQGTVSGAGEYPQGAQVKLTATPKDNYAFIGWSDGNTDNPRTISVDKAATYVAQFDRLSYTVYVNQDCSITVE